MKNKNIKQLNDSKPNIKTIKQIYQELKITDDENFPEYIENYIK